MRITTIIAFLIMSESLCLCADQMQSWSDMDLTNTYSSALTDADIDSTPVWQVGSDHPPLAPGKALHLATDYLAKLVPDSKVWTVESIELDHLSDEKHWFYVVLFKSPHSKDKQTGFDLQRQMHIQVLMSGVVVHKKITPHQPFKVYSIKPGSTNMQVHTLPPTNGHH
jgi:hypothetical protein